MCSRLEQLKKQWGDVKRCVKEAAGGGGYVLSSSNSIHDAVKVENFKAMIRAARRYSKYRIY